MNINEMQQEIMRLKKEKDICILAHSYQSKEIIEVADFTGDSFKLSVDATKVLNKNVLLCGVRFMAETAKILSPEKSVYLANPQATCPMAEQMDVAYIERIKAENPGYAVVAYINTTSALKTVCDVCVTSASAVKIVNAMENKNILFIPDCNLGNYVSRQCPDKNIKLLPGGCPIHAGITVEEAKKTKSLYPNAKFLVHPECIPAVVELADFVGSTSAIIKYAMESEETEFIIGTEISIADYLSCTCQDKLFYPLSKKLICPDMKSTTLADVYHALLGNGGEEILLDDVTVARAKACIDKMIALG